jgi:hypothetical protein
MKLPTSGTPPTLTPNRVYAAITSEHPRYPHEGPTRAVISPASAGVCWQCDDPSVVIESHPEHPEMGDLGWCAPDWIRHMRTT